MAKNLCSKLKGFKLDKQNTTVLTTVLVVVLGVLLVNHFTGSSLMNNIRGMVGGGGKTLYLFSTEWCGYCKKIKPEWEKLVSNNKDSGVNFEHVDADKDKALTEKYGVKGYPTLVLVVNGKPNEYSGERTASALEEFIKSN